jgi:ribosomal protein S12 methylthiotransferase
MRTTFIVGFPGETEAEFEELCAFVEAQRFERAGVFTYSLEPGTPAERLPDHLSEEVKGQRRDRLMRIQQRVAFAHAESKVGREIEALIDGPDPDVPGFYLARGTGDAPEIDCQVRLKGKNLRPGDLVQCRVTGADGYDLMARAIRVR